MLAQSINPKREMRATWLTTVVNIDWPVSTTKGMEAQQKELISLLDACVKFNMNTVMFHIRPACDALYKSSYEPWSSYLNNGRGVDPGWDPLQFCIDECHKRGIAVILDVVFNHATGQFPYAKMWWDSGKNKTASNNPFFNVDAPHNWSVFHDFNHTYAETVNYFDEVLEYWLEEYNIDGFRFDLTKGFVQNPGNYDAYGYSAQRIGILKHYAQTIRAVDEDAYVIFEHFCDQSEENELYNSVGALCWNNNQRNGYKQSVLGYTGSSFADFKKGRINNIETHDEERIAYKAITWGDSKSNWAVISKRLQAAYAFHFLTPYPKMMWQFGELGYDVSINANDSGVVGSGDEYRTHRKPVRWEYFNDANRKALYDALSKIISWRTDNEEYYGQDNLSVHSWRTGDAEMSGKTLVMDKVIVVANFTNAEATTNVSVPSSITGQWKNLLTGESVEVGGTYSVTLAGSDYIVLVRE